MKRENIFTGLTVLLGFISSIFFFITFYILETLRPKMVNFQALEVNEEALMNVVGVGLLIFLGFFLLSFYQIVKFFKKAKKISLFYLLLLASTVVSLLFIFADLALLNDIGKQYKQGLAQPEWLVLYLVMTFQFMTASSLTYVHLFKLKKESQTKYVARDSNIFLTVQYVGLICGLMGLSSSSLGFLFPRAWRLEIHTTVSSIVLLTPYVLVVIYWFLVKFQEKTRQWYDEKQIQDIGKSAFLTLVVSLIFMTLLFIANYNNLAGVVSILWFPLYIFLVLSLFSAGNLFFGQ